jgi:hypothetical protein
LVYVGGESGSVSGEFTTRGGVFAYSFDDTQTITGITSGASFDVIQTPFDLGITPLQLPITITGTANLDGDTDPDSIDLTVTLNLQVDPLDIHYAWMETIANAFSMYWRHSHVNSRHRYRRQKIILMTALFRREDL